MLRTWKNSVKTYRSQEAFTIQWFNRLKYSEKTNKQKKSNNLRHEQAVLFYLKRIVSVTQSSFVPFEVPFAMTTCNYWWPFSGTAPG